MKTISKTIQNRLSRFKYLFMAFLVAFSFSCSPEDGNDGAPGPEGSAGTNGTDGNANVISSDWFPTDFANSSFTFFDIADTNIDSETLSSSLIIAFGKINDDITISIPFTFSNRTYYIATLASTNSIRFIARTTDGTSNSFSDFTEVRYIIIPSGTTKTQTADLEKMTYMEVIDYFNLQE